MIKYVVIPQKKTVYAILNDTKYDAINRIEKMLHKGDDKHISIDFFYDDSFLLPNTFKATVVCDPRDEFTVEEGKKRARAKILRNYYRSVDKRIDKFRAALIEVNSKMFDTLNEVIEN